MLKFDTNLDEVSKEFSRMSTEIKKLIDMEGTPIVKDSENLVAPVSDAKIRLSGTNEEALDEAEYELVKQKKNVQPPTLSVAGRFIRDICKKVFRTK